MRIFRVWVINAVLMLWPVAGALAQSQGASCTAKPSQLASGCNISCSIGQSAYCTDAYNDQAGSCNCRSAGASGKGAAGATCNADTGSWHCSVVCPIGHSASCPEGGGPNQPECTCSKKVSKASNPSSYVDRFFGMMQVHPSFK